MSIARHTARLARVVALLCLALLLTVTAHESFVGIAVVVDGVPVFTSRGATVEDVAGVHAATRPGRMLSAVDRDVLSREKGLPGTVLVNGRMAAPGSIVHRGDCIVTIPGPDVIEPVVEETRSVEPVPATAKVIGVGPVEKMISGGSPGYVVLKVGALSREVVATETVVPAAPALVRHVPSPGANVVALTFDDGPWPGQTEPILAILEQRSVPATFFMLGMRVERAPDLARAVANAGHAIGNHTYWHVFLSTARPEVAAWEIEGTNQVIQSATGIRPVWLRAPGGELGGPAHQYIAQAGMTSALWTIDPQDWREGTPPEELAWSVIAAAHPGAIIVLHDGGGDQATTIAALPMIIDGLRAYGYEFVTLDELPSVRAGW